MSASTNARGRHRLPDARVRTLSQTSSVSAHSAHQLRPPHLLHHQLPQHLQEQQLRAAAAAAAGGAASPSPLSHSPGSNSGSDPPVAPASMPAGMLPGSHLVAATMAAAASTTGYALPGSPLSPSFSSRLPIPLPAVTGGASSSSSSAAPLSHPPPLQHQPRQQQPAWLAHSMAVHVAPTSPVRVGPPASSVVMLHPQHPQQQQHPQQHQQYPMHYAAQVPLLSPVFPEQRGDKGQTPPHMVSVSSSVTSSSALPLAAASAASAADGTSAAAGASSRSAAGRGGAFNSSERDAANVLTALFHRKRASVDSHPDVAKRARAEVPV